MAGVTHLVPRTVVHVDTDRLKKLYGDRSARDTEELLCRSMEDIALRLARVDQLWRAGNMKGTHCEVQMLIHLASQTGLSDLGKVAQNLQGLLDGHDYVATASVLARLVRLGEMSLYALWDRADPVF
ncbi:MAG: hypothetical protein JJ877_11615 [Thalassococcus sp.]|uniref:hypothetical protein n=1 Tax=Thalassococcus sp. TaxID=1928858 RepID=UPI001B1362D9|nr:hypothetical protein [Thalassococcus sp.]MBO6867680.1 hypothetical protein [Thalassococcus sp.]